MKRVNAAARNVKTSQIFDLTGRVAIITGGSVGLGRQMAEGLAEMGASLVLCARKKERCLRTAAELQAAGAQVLALACDVRDPASIQGVADAALERFGRIDILINNAGISWGAPVESMTLEQWNKVIETNLTGTFLFSQAVGRTMIAQRGGKIINIASVAGLGGSSPQVFRHWLQRQQRRSDHFHQRSRLQMGHAQYPGECDRTRLVSDGHVRKKLSSEIRSHSWPPSPWDDLADLKI